MKELLSACVYVDDPIDVAQCYAHRLAMRPIAVGAVGDDGKPRVVLVAGHDEPPWLALVSRRTAAGASNEPVGVPAGRGVRVLLCMTDDLDADAPWLEDRGAPEPPRLTVGELSLRWRSAAIAALGLRIDLVERPHERSRATDLAIAQAMAGRGLTAAADAASEGDPATLAALSAACRPSPDPSGMGDAPLDHMAVGVVDPACALEVTERVLGCRMFDELSVLHATGNARIRLVAQLPPDGFSFAIADTPASAHPFSRQIAERGGPGVHHVAHRVSDLERAMAAVVSAGGTLLSAIEEAPGLRQVFVSAADDGLVHELVQRTKVTGFVRRNTAGLITAEGEWDTSLGSRGPVRP